MLLRLARHSDIYLRINKSASRRFQSALLKKNTFLNIYDIELNVVFDLKKKKRTLPLTCRLSRPSSDRAAVLSWKNGQLRVLRGPSEWGCLEQLRCTLARRHPPQPSVKGARPGHLPRDMPRLHRSGSMQALRGCSLNHRRINFTIYTIKQGQRDPHPHK